MLVTATTHAASQKESHTRILRQAALDHTTAYALSLCQSFHEGNDIKLSISAPTYMTDYFRKEAKVRVIFTDPHLSSAG